MPQTITQIGGIRIVNGASYDALRTPITAYSTLTIPAYWRAMCFLADNLTSFPRTIQRAGIDTKHFLDGVLARRPNAYQSATTFWRSLFFARVHRGNAYAEIRRTGNRIDSLHVLLTDNVTPFRLYRDDGDGLPEQWYYHAPTQKFLPAADVIHLSGLSYDGMAGIDPTYQHADTFERAKNLDRHLNNYVLKGTVLRGSVEFPPGTSPEQVAETVSILKTYSGPDAEGDVLVLSGAHLENKTLTPQAGQLIEQARQINNDISRITGVPPQFVYEFGETKYNNPIDAGQDVVRHTFRTLIEGIEDELSQKLLTPQERDAEVWVNLDPDALLRGDPKAQTEIAVAQKTAGIATENESREAVGLPQRDDPKADEVTTLGDTTPQAVRTPPTKSSTAATGETFAALKPIIDATVERIETKTAKAFQTHGTKPDPEKTVWANVFSTQQATFVADALAPVAETVRALGGAAVPVQTIADQYAAQVRRRAATGDETDLAKLIADQIGGGNDAEQPEE